MPSASSGRGRGARASRRPISDRKPPNATSAPPSQIRVTNGFHHSRSCQRPCVVRLAERDVELAVEHGLDRRLAGRRRRRAEHPRLRAQREGAAAAASRVSRASIAVQFGPATGSTPSKRTLNGPARTVWPGLAATRVSVVKALSEAMPASATAMPRWAVTMPQVNSGVRLQIALPQRREAGRGDAERESEAEQGQDADAGREQHDARGRRRR